MLMNGDSGQKSMEFRKVFLDRVVSAGQAKAAWFAKMCMKINPLINNSFILCMKMASIRHKQEINSDPGHFLK